MALLADKNGLVILRFGAGLNSQSALHDVDPRECTAGKNFELLSDSALFRPRRPIAKACTAPNGAEVRGFVQLVKADGSRSFLVQAGSTVYQWDGTAGSAGLTGVGSVSASAQLRGRIESNSVKDSKVYIADLNQMQPVLTWDGTTLAPLDHNLSGDFYAKYIVVDRERALYGNVYAGTALPHVVVASEQDSLAVLTITDRPSTSLSASDPFFVGTPNLAPIRGLVSAFGKVAIATTAAEWFQFAGIDATDIYLDLLYAGEAGTGAEAVAFVGNDVVFGKQGGIDTLSATERYGDVKSDDLTRWLTDEVRNVTSWTMEYSKRFDKLFCIPNGGGKVYVMYKAFLDARTRTSLFGGQVGDVSPWSVWQTDNAFNFVPTATMRMYDPISGLEYVYMGDSSGNVWQMDSESVGSDGGTAFNIERTSAPFRQDPAALYNLNGYVKARKAFAGNISITALWGGETIVDSDTQTVTLDAASGVAVWGAGSYWGGPAYWGTNFSGRLQRKPFTANGSSDECQLKITVASSSLSEFHIEEIGIQLTPQKDPARRDGQRR